MLKAVKISKGETCLTYVLKRVGLDMYLHLDSEDLIKEGIMVECNIHDLKTGDIIMFINNPSETIVKSLNGYITEDGRIIEVSVKYSYHFAVFEGNIEDIPIVSHIVNIDNLFKSISLKDLRTFNKKWKKLII